jgi:hypothetical protein
MRFQFLHVTVKKTEIAVRVRVRVKVRVMLMFSNKAYLINFRRRASSFGSLKTINGPGYLGKGVYSKSETSSETISRFIIRYPCPGVM